MRFAKMFLSLLALALAGSAMAGSLSPGLEAYLAEKHDGGSIKTLVVLRDQVDIAAMDLDLYLQRATRAHRHFQVVTALQEKAGATQPALRAELDRRLGKGIDGYKSYWLINAIVVTGTVGDIREIAARDDVEVVELDLIPELIKPVSVEPIGEKSMTAIGITPGVVNIGARRVWDELGIRGEGAIIGSLDTGVAGAHPALASRWRGLYAPWQHCWLDVLGTNTQFPNDGHGHGTHTTGTMTGLAANDTIGVAPGALWIATNAINQGANPGFDSDILDCLEFFTDPDGNPATLDDVPDVVQNSWGVHEGFSGYVDCDSRWWVAIDACEAAGVVLTWSAGNEGPSSTSLRSPADRATTLYNCFSVGSTQHSPPFSIASSSSRGPAGPNCGPVENRMKPEISAPGVDIYSSYPSSGYTYMSGTSMAGPHVAGVVALMRSANPNVDVITIKQILMETAIDLGTAGEDNTYGHGFLNAYEAVLAVLGGLGWVEGTVTDRTTGFPIVGAQITVAGGYQSAVTTSAGFFRLTLPVGPATINFAAFGYDPQSIVVEVLEDQTINRIFPLQPLPTATVTGVVYTAGEVPPGGLPAAGAIVAVADTPLEAITTNAAGEFTLYLPRGTTYVIQAGLSGIGAISQAVPVDADLYLDLYLSELTQDGFETGNFAALPWTFAGNANWYVQSTQVYQGTYAARSGAIGDNQSSSLDVTIDCGAGGEVSFWYKVSSEATYDFLEFYVDGSRLDRWSGEVGWARYATNVSAGTHNFRWRYVKDWSVANGSDCGWIDEVIFPGGATPLPLAVPMPWTLAASLEHGEATTLPLVLMNQGLVPLTFTAAGEAWATVVDGEGTIDAYGFHVMQVHLDAAGLPAGTHGAAITINSNDTHNPTLEIQVTLQVTGGATAVEQTPAAFALLGAVPNPFNPQTTIHFALPADSHADLRLYDVQGRLVRTLVSGPRPAGLNEARWDGRDNSGRAAASGTYFARLQAGGRQSVKSLVLVR